MKMKLTLGNKQQQRIILRRKLIIAGSSVLGMAAAIVVVMNTANTHETMASTSKSVNVATYNNNGAAVEPANSIVAVPKSAGSAIPKNELAGTNKNKATGFATRSASASKTVIASAAKNAAAGMTVNANFDRNANAERIRKQMRAYNAQETEFMKKVAQRDLTVAASSTFSDADIENNAVLNNTDAAANMRKFMVTYVPETVTAELLNFDAKRDGGRIVLKWSTGVEKNNDYFTIERSDDQASYEEIGKVSGNGNSLDKSDYKFIDKHPKPGKNYYRLKHTDKTGNTSYFAKNIVEI